MLKSKVKSDPKIYGWLLWSGLGGYFGPEYPAT